MAARGRPAKAIIDTDVNHMPPKELKARQEATPQYKSQEFIPPEDLTDQELEVWNWLVKVFRETTNCMVSDADKHLMQLYCRAKVAADNADAAIKKDDRYYIIVPLGTNKNGELKTTAKANPNYKIRIENSQLCLKLFDQLGLSPVARARVGIGAANAKKEVDIFADLMNRSDD